MAADAFKRYEEKLARNVYGTLKGRIRQELLLADIRDGIPGFSGGGLEILDIGAGAAGFARICCAHGHRVWLLDSSPTMLEQARQTMAANDGAEVCYLHADFLGDVSFIDRTFDLVLMHGSAEWMEDPEEAIVKAAGYVKANGYLSLMVFNRDRLLLKQGINGKLRAGAIVRTGRIMTPPGALSPDQILALSSFREGEVVFLSGIRIFYGFFREIDTAVLDEESWLAQERAYYRRKPFSLLGEHTHLLWKKSGK